MSGPAVGRFGLDDLVCINPFLWESCSTIFSRAHLEMERYHAQIVEKLRSEWVEVPASVTLIIC